MQGWAVSKNFDNKFLLSPFLLTPTIFLLWLLMQKMGQTGLDAATVIFLVFVGLFDQPHIARTFARTHFDQIEFLRHRVAHILLIPILFLLGIASIKLRFAELLLFVIAVLGQWHIFRQNFGFVRIFPIENSDINLTRKIRSSESNFFLLLFLNSLTPYLLRSDLYFSELLAPARELIIIWKWLVLLLCIVVGSIWLINSLRANNHSKKLIRPKYLFVLGVVFVYAINYQLASWVPIQLMIVLETCYHDIQYQGWMNLYQQRVLRQSKRGVRYWLFGSFVYGLVMLYISETLNEFAIFVNMLVLYHYIIEGFIWKFKSQPELKTMLSEYLARP